MKILTQQNLLTYFPTRNYTRNQIIRLNYIFITDGIVLDPKSTFTRRKRVASARFEGTLIDVIRIELAMTNRHFRPHLRLSKIAAVCDVNPNWRRSPVDVDSYFPAHYKGRKWTNYSMWLSCLLQNCWISCTEFDLLWEGDQKCSKIVGLLVLNLIWFGTEGEK